jgi:hypothetical protein
MLSTLAQAQLANRSAAAFSGVQAAGATAAERAAQVEALNAALQVKESQLAEALKEIADLKVRRDGEVSPEWDYQGLQIPSIGRR